MLSSPVTIVNCRFTNFTGGFLNLLDATLDFHDCNFTNFKCEGYDSLVKATKSSLKMFNISVLGFSGEKPGALFKFGQET